jgi:Bacterial Ig-like domain
VTDTSPDGTASKAANVTATFDEPVQNMTSSTFFLERKIAVKKAPPKFERVDATVSLSTDGKSAELNPALDLPKGDYRATITTDVTDLADNPLEDPVVWTFTVRK